MSIDTNAQLNGDQLQAALVALAPGAGFSSMGADLPVADTKTITPIGATDAQLQAAITTATGQFIDYSANQAAIQSRVRSNQQAIANWIAANPNGAVLNAQQTLVLAKMLNGLCLLLMGQFGSTTGS